MNLFFVIMYVYLLLYKFYLTNLQYEISQANIKLACS
uniref:Uncharacterized protein n=1 Tax=Phyllymenia taiwanensis TaxID=1260292 RepID=R9XWD4_9FLOR|nr:hypothetical protein [Grateloupia taiwanensis]AGO19787.1 hypothetical protein [Grateloupia taiwanensis]